MLPFGVEIIEAGKQRMFDRARGQLRFQLRVGGDAVAFAHALHRAAADRLARNAARDRVRAGGERVPRQHDDAIDGVEMRVAAVVAQGDRIVELMREEGADQILVAVERVPARFAQIGVIGDIAAIALVERAERGQELEGRSALIALILAQDRPAGAVGRLPGDAGRNIAPADLHIFHLRVAIARQAHQPGREGGADRAADVGRRLIIPVVEVGRADPLQHEIGLEFVGRTLGDDVDDAARRGLAIERARGTLQHLNLLQRIGIEARPRPLTARGQAQAVDEIIVGRKAAGAEAAHRHFIDAAVDAEGFGLDASGIGQRIGDAGRGAQLDFLAADDRDRLRRFDDRRRALRGGNGGGPAGGGHDDDVGVPLRLGRGLGLR